MWGKLFPRGGAHPTGGAPNFVRAGRDGRLDGRGRPGFRGRMGVRMDFSRRGKLWNARFRRMRAWLCRGRCRERFWGAAGWPWALDHAPGADLRSRLPVPVGGAGKMSLQLLAAWLGVTCRVETTTDLSLHWTSTGVPQPAPGPDRRVTVTVPRDVPGRFLRRVVGQGLSRAAETGSQPGGGVLWSRDNPKFQSGDRRFRGYLGY